MPLHEAATVLPQKSRQDYDCGAAGCVKRIFYRAGARPVIAGRRYRSGWRDRCPAPPSPCKRVVLASAARGASDEDWGGVIGMSAPGESRHSGKGVAVRF